MQKLQKTYQIIWTDFSHSNLTTPITYLAHQWHSIVKSLWKFFLVADLIVDGCNAYQQSQCSPQKTVTPSQNTPGCICMWALLSPCCLRFDHLFIWILPFDLPGLVRPARSWSFRQYSSQGCGITKAPLPIQGWWFSG